jgi:hypothetical protein
MSPLGFRPLSSATYPRLLRDPQTPLLIAPHGSLFLNALGWIHQLLFCAAAAAAAAAPACWLHLCLRFNSNVFAVP